MKLSDRVWGLLLLAFAAALLWHIRTFPPMPGQRFGPAVFPGIVAVGLAICAVILIVRDIIAQRRTGDAHTWAALALWTRAPRQLMAFAVVVIVNVMYVLLATPLGFIPTAVAYLVALFLVFGVRTSIIVPLAIGITLVIHYAFYKLLKVPLPWGILERYAW